MYSSGFKTTATPPAPQKKKQKLPAVTTGTFIYRRESQRYQISTTTLASQYLCIYLKMDPFHDTHFIDFIEIMGMRMSLHPLCR